MGKSDNVFSFFTAESKFYSICFPNSWPAVVFLYVVSCAGIANTVCVSEKNIRKWIGFFKIHILLSHFHT